MRRGNEAESGHADRFVTWTFHGYRGAGHRAMNRNEHELSHPFLVTHPRIPGREPPFTGDVDAWLIRLEVYTPFDPDRTRDLEQWRHASARAHADAFRSLLSIVDALPPGLHPKAPLVIRFPKPYHGAIRPVPHEP